MDVLTWAWRGNNGFYLPTSAALAATFAHFSFSYSISFPPIVLFLAFSCPFLAGEMPRIDDAYSRWLMTVMTRTTEFKLLDSSGGCSYLRT